jgi:adenylate kinase family enzyme
MKRILILGISGSGKSTLAKQLHGLSKIPVFHLDKIFWQPDWQFPDAEFWENSLLDISRHKYWIIEGNFESALELLVPKADTVIILNISKIKALFRVGTRWHRFRRKDRDDRPDGCKEKIDFDFIKYIWNFKKKREPSIRHSLKKRKPNAKIFWLYNKNDLQQFFKLFSNHYDGHTKTRET